MKTRQEMIYEFMVALASNSSLIDARKAYADESADFVVLMANKLSDKFLEIAQ